MDEGLFFQGKLAKNHWSLATINDGGHCRLSNQDLGGIRKNHEHQ